MKLSLTGVAVVLAVAAPAIATATPTIRVEGIGATVVPTLPAPVASTGTVTVADTTDADTIAVAASSATAQLATTTRWFGLPLGFDLFDFGGPSSFVTQIGRARMPADFSLSWRLKVNHKLTASGSDTTTVGPNDAVLWSFVEDFETPELDVVVARRNVPAGSPVTVRVRSFDNQGVATPATEATVSLAGRTTVSSADGRAVLRPSVTGPRFVVATKAGTVRSARQLVCVQPADTPRPCSSVSIPLAPGRGVTGLTILGGQATAPRVEVSVCREVFLGQSAEAPRECRYLTRGRTSFGADASQIWIPLGVADGRWELRLAGPFATSGLTKGSYLIRSRARAGATREITGLSGVNDVRLNVR